MNAIHALSQLSYSPVKYKDDFTFLMRVCQQKKSELQERKIKHRSLNPRLRQIINSVSHPTEIPAAASDAFDKSL
jgi:hypothetical protein